MSIFIEEEMLDCVMLVGLLPKDAQLGVMFELTLCEQISIVTIDASGQAISGILI